MEKNNALAQYRIETNECHVVLINKATENIDINYHIKKEIISISDNEQGLVLTFSLEENPLIDLTLRITGHFIFDQSIPVDDASAFMNKRAVQVVFPYLRTMISTVTASLMLEPIVLPVIDSSTI